MSVQPIAIETAVGTLSGRDAIYLDDTTYSYRTRVLTLEGEINVHGCSKPPDGDWIGYEIRFEGVDSFRVIELDCWEAGDWDWPDGASLVEMPRSAWIDELNTIASSDESDRLRWPRVPDAFRHFVVCTYDHIFEVVAQSMKLDLGEVRRG